MIMINIKKRSMVKKIMTNVAVMMMKIRNIRLDNRANLLLSDLFNITRVINKETCKSFIFFVGRENIYRNNCLKFY